MQNGRRRHFLNPQQIRKIIPDVAHTAQLTDRRCEEIPPTIVKEKDKRAISLCNASRRPLNMEVPMNVPIQMIITDTAMTFRFSAI
jgi:hypothetical protein